MAPGSRLRRHLRGVEPRIREARCGRKRDGRGPGSHSETRNEWVSPRGPFARRPQGEVWYSSVGGFRLSWPTADFSARRQSHRREQDEQRSGQSGVGVARRQHLPRLQHRAQFWAERYRRKQSPRQAHSGPSYRDSRLEGQDRRSGSGPTVRRLTVGHSVHSSGEALGVGVSEWPEDLRVREMPDA